MGRPSAALALVLAAAAPAGAFELEPYVRVGAETGWEGNITGRGSVALEPLASVFREGAGDVLGAALLDAGADAWLTDALGCYAGVSARGIGFATYPGFGYVTGSATLQGRALELPGDLDATLGYGYRDDFQGWRAHWLSVSIERPLPWALVGYAAAGYDWAAGNDARQDRSGPFGDLGLRRRFRGTGTSVRLALDVSAPAYTAGRQDTVASALLGVSQRLTTGVYLTARARLDLASSTEANRSYVAPAAALGWAWILP